MSGRTVHLREIAERAGVSRMTVSLALRDSSRVAESTRKRIRKLAREMGFSPDPTVANAMSALARGQHASAGERLAFLTSDVTENGWRMWQHNVNCFEGARERAAEYGYELEPFWLKKSGQDSRKMSRILWSRGIEGILIAPLGDDLRTFEFDWDRFSTVELGETMTFPHFDCARHDHFDGMLLALFSMECLGYRRIGLAMELMLDVRTRHRWYSAYLLWQRVREYNDLSVLFYEKFDIDRISLWIKQNRFDAVISSRNELCDELREVGFDVPGDVGVAVLDRPSGDPTKNLSGIHQNASAIGSAAADMLVNLVRRNGKGIPSLPSQKICAGTWTEGSTTRRVGPPLEACSLLDRSVVL